MIVYSTEMHVEPGEELGQVAAMVARNYSLVDRPEVPPAKSCISIKATFNPLAVASNAIPAPVIPPPITSISKVELLKY